MANKNRKQAFFEEDTEHGRVKRIMYKKYIQAYIAKTQNEKFTLRTMIIDGFAGVGRYGNDWPSEIERYGSPLIALMVALGDCYKKEKEQRKDETGEAKDVDKGKDTAANIGTNKTVKESLQTDDQEDKSNTKEDSIWGWPASGLESEAELTGELQSGNKRKRYRDRRFKVALIFIEKDPKRFKMLTENVELLIIKFLKTNYPSCRYGYSFEEGEVRLSLSAAPFSISVVIINRKFGDTPPPSSLHDSDLRSLTFLDPFGFTQTPMTHVAKFAPGVGNEIFINLMSRDVNRFVSKSTEGVVELYGISDYENVARCYGIDPPDPNDEDALVEFVKYIIHFCQSDKEPQLNNINKCAANYESYLKEETNSNYSLTFQVKDKGNNTIYHMIHVTNHIKGVEAMKESMNRCSQEEGKLIMSAYDIVQKGLKLNLGNLDDPGKVADAIFKRYKGKKRVLLEHIKWYILFDTNFVFRKKPLAILQKEGKIIDVVDTEHNHQRIRFKFPDKEKETKEPILWLISFSDENFICDHEIKPKKKRKEPSEKSKQLRELKRQKREMLKAEKQKERQRKREERKKEIDEKKRRQLEERLQKKRKREERKKLIEENKKKRDEAKLEKKRKVEAIENERQRSRKLITDMFKSTPITAIEGKVGDHQHGATNVPNECFGDTWYAAQVIALQSGDLTTQSTRKPTKNGSKRIREEKENDTNMKQQPLITNAFVTQKGLTGCPLKGNTQNRDISTNDVMEGVENPSDVSQRRKRKRKSTSAASPGDNGKSKKIAKVSSGSIQSTSSSPLDTQRVLTQYFRPPV